MPAKILCSELRIHHGKPTLFVDGNPEQPILYALTDLPGGRLTYEEMPQHNILRMSGAGVRIFQFCLFFEAMWKEGATLDISEAKKLVRGITDVCPEAMVMIRLHLHPPLWWQKAHPEECVQYAGAPAADRDDGARFSRVQQNDPELILRYSLASKLWKKTMTEMVAEFCRALATSEEGNRVVGIQVAGGVYGEWHYWGGMSGYPDICAPMQRHFREWLREKYETDASIQAAWGNRQVSFENALVPDLAEREDTSNGLFLKLPEQQNLADYYKCQHGLVADCILHFARTVKESWGRPIIVGTFYGYCFPVYMRETTGGHLELQRVLKSPDIDYLSAPQCYWPHALEPGDPARSRGLNASCRLNGKLWLDEYDTQPNITDLTRVGADPNTPEYEAALNAAIAVVRRNMSVSAVQGQGFWFFDFGVCGGRQYEEAKDQGSNGWWDFPPLLSAITKTTSVFKRQMEKPYASDADVLMVYDTEAYYHLNTNKDLLAPVYVATYWGSAAVWRAGISADYIHLDDLDKVDMRQYRVAVFNNTCRLTGEQRGLVRRNVLNNDRHVIWFYAPGYFDGVTHSDAGIADITGINVRSMHPEKALDIEVRAEGFMHQYGISDKPVTPLFFVDDGEAESLGYFEGLNRTAVARKSLPGFTSWYVALPEYGPKLMKYLLSETGAHCYGDQNEVIYAGNNMLILHSMREGEHVVHLKNGRDITCRVPAGGATIILDSETGEVME